MKHLSMIAVAALLGSPGLAAESARPVGGLDGLIPEPHILLSPRPGTDGPPMRDTYRCEPTIRMEDGTPAAFGRAEVADGADRARPSWLCDD